MRHLTLISLTICTSVIVGIDASAQQPSPPAAGPAPVPYGTPITLEQAKKVAAGAEAEAKKNNWNMTIAIAEPSGSLVYLQKMDGAPYASVNVAPDNTRQYGRRCSLAELPKDHRYLIGPAPVHRSKEGCQGLQT
jgi:glc operon protein GlcG